MQDIPTTTSELSGDPIPPLGNHRLLTTLTSHVAPNQGDIHAMFGHLFKPELLCAILAQPSSFIIIVRISRGIAIEKSLASRQSDPRNLIFQPCAHERWWQRREDILFVSEDADRY